MKGWYRVNFADALRVSDQLLREAMPDLVHVVGEKARDYAPKGWARRGRDKSLAANIEERIEQGGMQKLRGAVVATARHAYIVHEGTRAHAIAPRSKKALRIPSAMGAVVRAGARHPGAKGQPFLTNALRDSGPEIRERLKARGPGLLRKVLG